MLSGTQCPRVCPFLLYSSCLRFFSSFSDTMPGSTRLEGGGGGRGGGGGEGTVHEESVSSGNRFKRPQSTRARQAVGESSGTGASSCCHGLNSSETKKVERACADAHTTRQKVRSLYRHSSGMAEQPQWRQQCISQKTRKVNRDEEETVIDANHTPGPSSFSLPHASQCASLDLAYTSFSSAQRSSRQERRPHAGVPAIVSWTVGRSYDATH